MQEKSLIVEKSNAPSPAGRGRGSMPAVLFAMAAVVALGAAVYFWWGQYAARGALTASRAQAVRAEHNFAATKTAIEAIVVSLADSLSTPGGVQAEGVAAILGSVENAVGTLVTTTNDDPELRHRQASMYVRFSATYLAVGNVQRAIDSARKGTAIFRALAEARPANTSMQSDVGLSLAALADALRAGGDNTHALAADRESLDIARALAGREPGNSQFRVDVVLALWRLASANDNPRERLVEALKILKNLKLAAVLTPAQEEWMRMIEDDLSKQR